MLYTFLLVLLVIDCVVLILAILLQSGKGTGLAASFGGASSSPDALIGIRQAGNLLTRISWWGGGIFLGLCFILQIMSTHTSAPRSVLEKGLTTQPQNVAPAPPPPLPVRPNPPPPRRLPREPRQLNPQPPPPNGKLSTRDPI